MKAEVKRKDGRLSRAVEAEKRAERMGLVTDTKLDPSSSQRPIKDLLTSSTAQAPGPRGTPSSRPVRESRPPLPAHRISSFEVLDKPDTVSLSINPEPASASASTPLPRIFAVTAATEQLAAVLGRLDAANAASASRTALLRELREKRMRMHITKEVGHRPKIAPPEYQVDFLIKR